MTKTGEYTKEGPHPPPPKRPRTGLGENSQEFGVIAEKGALLRNRRIMDADSRGAVGVVREQRRGPPPQEFPIFMVSISLLQALFFYSGGANLRLYFGYDPFRRHELWRYFTNMFVHQSGSHLWGNVAFQLLLGSDLEEVHRWRRISVVYIAGVFGGSLAISILAPLHYGVGASAGVYALLTAHVATILINWSEMDNKKGRRLFCLLLTISVDLSITAHDHLYPKRHAHNSHVGHFGGALLGFIVAVFVLRNSEMHPWERRLRKILAVLIAVIFGVVLIVNVAFPSHYRKTEWNFNYFDTYTRYVIERVRESEHDSRAQQLCRSDADCRDLLQLHANNVNRS